MSDQSTTRVAVITGASSGIGAASAKSLSEAGFHVVLGARRVEKLSEVANSVNGDAIALDVTDQASVDAFTAEVQQRFGRCDLLLNNAGGAIGTESIEDANVEDWQWMYDVNVLGVLRLTKALLPALKESGDGQVITIGSIAAREPYRGGAGYNAAKHAVAAVTRVLRMELLGEPVRVAEIDPGMVNTEFSTVRFRGDQQAADDVYAGMTPLSGADIAEAVAWIASRPAHVNIDQILMMPRDQVAAKDVFRRGN